jgi:DNA-damage-inducible protein J
MKLSAFVVIGLGATQPWLENKNWILLVQCIYMAHILFYTEYTKTKEMIIVADTTNISIRLDVELKKQAERLFSELGMNMTTAFNIFLRQAVRQQRIPFDIALEEAERISHDPSVPGYTDAEQMMKELLADV